MKTPLFLGFLMVAPIAFASPLSVQKTVAADPTVRSLVQTMAAQSLSGDPVYCDLETPKVIATKAVINDLEFQVVYSCGPGESEKSHSASTQVFVKGYIEDSMVFTTGVQVGKRLR